MKKKKVFYLSFFGGIGLLGLIALTLVIYTQRNKEAVVLSADEVGITRILSEEIVSVEFDNVNPNYIGDCKDISAIRPLLDITANAVYHPAKKPRKLFGFALIYIETADHRYSMGYVNGVFEFSVDGDCKYYDCSDGLVFLNQFDEILDQWALTGQKKYL